MKTMLVILAIAFFPSMNLFAKESREVQQQTGIEDRINKATSSCNERVFSERIMKPQNILVAETAQDKCYRTCEDNKKNCGSGFKCEADYNNCLLSCQR